MNEAIIITQFLAGISYYIEPNTRFWGWEKMKESGLKRTLKLSLSCYQISELWEGEKEKEKRKKAKQNLFS